MAKNKNNRSGFDKFNSGGSAAVSDPPVTTVEVPDDDEADGAEPTDTVPAEELPPATEPPDAGDGTSIGEVPMGAYIKLNQESMKATNIAEQEQILASLHPKHNTMRDPGLDYQRCLTSGRSLPPFKAKADADPLLVRTKDLLERMLAGGLIVPSAYGVYNQGVDLVTDIIKAIEEKPDAEPGQGSAGGNAQVGG